MDRTINPVRRSSKKRRDRNHKAWKNFSPDGSTCRFCSHKGTDHLMRSGQPHFYRPDTLKEQQHPRRNLRNLVLPDGNTVTVKRVTVSKQAELITAYCITCAQNKQTHQATCYSRVLANGEIVGLETTAH